MTDAAALAERVEQAEGPSKALDAEIECAVFFAPHDILTFPIDHGKRGQFWAEERGGEIREAPSVTSSLDAAVAFVARLDDQAWWSIDIDGRAKVCLPDDVIGWSPPDGELRSCAKTPAMALVAAALRALAHDAPPASEGGL